MNVEDYLEGNGYNRTSSSFRLKFDWIDHPLKYILSLRMVYGNSTNIPIFSIAPIILPYISVTVNKMASNCSPWSEPK